MKVNICKQLEDMFDMFCVVMTTKPKTKNVTLKTLERLGILTVQNILSGKVHIQYDMPNVARQIVKSHVKCMNRFNQRDNVFWVTLNHYYALAATFHSGAQHALILEDDAVELKDIVQIQEFLSNVPKGYDFINFGALPTGGPDGVSNFKKMLAQECSSKYYAKNWNSRNAHAYAISRKFMEKLLTRIEGALLNENGLELLVNDQWFKQRLFKDCSMWFSRKPLFVQQWDPTCKCKNSVYDMYYSLYEGVKKEDYFLI